MSVRGEWFAGIIVVKSGGKEYECFDIWLFDESIQLHKAATDFKPDKSWQIKEGAELFFDNRCFMVRTKLSPLKNVVTVKGLDTYALFLPSIAVLETPQQE